MTDQPLQLGLVINPIAGMGGAVGLKGTDGARLHEARARGATARAGQRVARALCELALIDRPVNWLTAAGDMGEHALLEMGMTPQIVHRPAGQTSRDDTLQAVKAMVSAPLDLLLFAGGDGTARDVLEVVGDRVVVLGIPAGVKMHSAVFAVSPRAAGDAARRYLETGGDPRLRTPAEVLDRELNEAGEPASSPTLYGYLTTLRMPSLVQAAKATGGGGDQTLYAALPGLARELHNRGVAVLGPGATLRALKAEMGLQGTLLGVDIVFGDGRPPLLDASEEQVWQAVRGQRAMLALGVIGGQGFLIGRGNQQISARVLGEIAREDLRVIASQEKLTALPGSRLYVDSTDDEMDAALAGFLPVITGPRRKTLCRVVAGSQ